MLKLAKKGWFTAIQFATIPANFILTKLLKLKVVRPTNFHLNHGTLIIANHQSKIDPFLISYHVGVHNLLNVTPLRYPVTPNYMNKKILGFFIHLLGGYSIGENSLERLKKLMFTRELLRDKYTVVIFPEGKIVRDADAVAEFAKGAETLFSENYPVVFVRLSGLNNEHKFKFWQNHSARFEYSEYLGPEVTKEEKIAVMIKFFGVTTPLT